MYVVFSRENPYENTTTWLFETQDKKPFVGPFLSPKKLTHDMYISLYVQMAIVVFLELK